MKLLAAHTRTPDDCWFGVWDGYGFLEGGPAFAQLQPHSGQAAEPWVARPSTTAPRITINDRSLLLYRGPIAAAHALNDFDQSPNLWWPDDHAWCVATDIDLPDTHVGGTEELIEALLASERR